MRKPLALVSSVVVVLHGFVGCTDEAPPPKTSASVVPTATAPTVAPSTSATTSPAPQAPCVPPLFAGGPLNAFELKGGKLVVCVAAPDDPGWVSCLSFDPKTSTYDAAPGFVPTPAVDVDWPVGLATDGANAKVCLSNAPKDCKTVKPGFKPTHKPEFEGAVSIDGKRLFLYKYVATPAKSATIAQHKLFGEVFDVTTGKKTASFPLPVGTPDKPLLFADQTDEWRASWYGAHLVVSSYRCCGPAGGQAFVDPKTGKLHGIGDPTLLLQLDDDTFLVGNEWPQYGATAKAGRVALTVFDAKTFTPKELPLPNKPREEPETFVLGSAKLDDGTIALAYANPPGIVIFDPKTKTLGDAKAAPICSGTTGAATPSSGGTKVVTTISDHLGETVSIDVTKAKTISQHMMSMVPGKNPAYFAPVGSDVDFVAYVATPPSCGGTIRLTGKVIEVSGPGKGPKTDKPYAERQLDVDSAECR